MNDSPDRDPSTRPPAPNSSGEDEVDEDEVDAPFWTKAVLTLLPFVLVAGFLFLDSCRNS